MVSATDSRGLAIGAVSRETGVNIETIRYYERIGLLPAPGRTDGGNRQYETAHLRRLRFIRRGRELGFSLDELRGFITLEETGEQTCAEVKARSEHHLADVRAKIADLQRIELVLAETTARCSGDHVPECAVLDALSGQADW